LRETGRELAAGKGIHFDLIVGGRPYVCLPKVEEHLLRIGREAVTNAIRHANPSRVMVELVYEPESVSLKVTDDGSGFDPHAPGFVTGAHWGLASMRERAAQINARFNLTSSRGKGTALELIVPAAKMRS
jgi:signal transduction histidine kinase